MKKFKRSVVKEELVAITGGSVVAQILNQFLYWSERVGDVDGYISEENRRRKNHGMDEFDLVHGWIYKTADQLDDELMLGMSDKTILKHVAVLMLKGYLSRRTNPKYKWDRTMQYRVNLIRVMSDLEKIGYHLEGYRRLLRVVEGGALEGGELMEDLLRREERGDFDGNLREMELQGE